MTTPLLPAQTLSGLDRVVCADALTYLRSLPNNYVNCVVTSPPYFGLRDYQVAGQIGLEQTPAEFVAKLVALFREVKRVLRDDGVIWVNMGDSYNNYGTDSTLRTQSSSIGLTAEFAGEYSRGAKLATPGLNRKQLLGMPWRVAFGLQDDGWILRSDVIWHKPNPMPESVIDRPTKSHEYVFLLAKQERYWYDADAIRECAEYGENRATFIGGTARLSKANIVSGGFVPSDKGMDRPETSSRNKRTVWTIATEPTPFAHFATFPQKLIEPMVLAGCPHKVCAVCGAPWVRQVEREAERYNEREGHAQALRMAGVISGGTEKVTLGMTQFVKRTDLGFARTCAHTDVPIRAGIVLDPFMGSGTTALVARRLGRHYIGSELNPAYVKLCNERLSEAYTLPIPLFLELPA